MNNPFSSYARWLHLGWPAGNVEPMPEVREDGSCAVPGVRIVGDLTGVPLLKFALDTGARAVRAIVQEDAFRSRRSSHVERDLPAESRGARPHRTDDRTQDRSGDGRADARTEGRTDARPEGIDARNEGRIDDGTYDGTYDLIIVGAGVAGMAAAVEASKHGLRFLVFEATHRFSTLLGFPKGKPIFTYPNGMVPEGELQVHATQKESLLAELEAQVEAAGIAVTMARVDRVRPVAGELDVCLADGKTVRALRVIVAIGRSGHHRRLGVPGEGLPKVSHRLYDPMDFEGKAVLVVGGGDAAVEAATALARAGADVTLSYRRLELARPKPENIENLEACKLGTPAGGRLTCRLPSRLRVIEEGAVELEVGEGTKRIERIRNDSVFLMIGREPPLDFFRRSGIPIRGEWRIRQWISFVAFLSFCFFLYQWKASGVVNGWFRDNGWFPYNVRSWLGASVGDPSTVLGTLAITLEEPGFYYSLAYTVAVVLFGVDRMRRRRTPYVRRQTWTLMGIQTIPLFFLPYLILPLLGHNGAFDDGWMHQAGDALFPLTNYGHGREYWRAFGFVLAWPLFIWNFFTPQPMTWWLVIGLAQTFVLIPWLVFRYGKGAYCGWICSCGALAETLGDRHRHKMPHGPRWNRLNFVGQVILVWALLLFAARIISWTAPTTGVGAWFEAFFSAGLSGFDIAGLPLNYYKVVDVFLAGVVGVGFYFWFSGRVWCRFACPLAALMHIYARFSRFAIIPEKKKCISCNVCTSVCHQGIDVMSFANKGHPMIDPQCVRCSACVQMCPTGVLSFGEIRADGLVRLGRLAASPLARPAQSAGENQETMGAGHR
ncbi:MAG: NAD(P)-binding domain-containing protein [Deltaproteobacteria bacterium]|nr:NAD(P)-binding domain-containing protein [Deltaproteobacteria bacterium]